MSDERTARLDAFRLEIQAELAYGTLSDRQLPVVNDEGQTPLVVALDEERLPVLLKRVENLGGYANVFTKGPQGVRQIAVLNEAGALDTRGADRMLHGEQPSADSTVGVFVDYLDRSPEGVVLPGRLASVTGDVPALPPRQAERVPL